MSRIAIMRLLSCMLFASHAAEKTCMFTRYHYIFYRKAMIDMQPCFANPTIPGATYQSRHVRIKCANILAKWHIGLAMSSDSSYSSESCVCEATGLPVQERRELATRLQSEILSQQDHMQGQEFLTFLQPVPRPNSSVSRSLERIRQYACSQGGSG
jgi:hypothetical protein